MNGWLIVFPGVMAALTILGALWITSDDYRGAHTGAPEENPGRHRATGLDDPTTQIIWKGTAHVEAEWTPVRPGSEAPRTDAGTGPDDRGAAL